MLLIGESEGDGLCLEEEEGGGDGEEGYGSVVEEALDAACCRWFVRLVGGGVVFVDG